jgi:hypothetical protein
MFKQDKVPKYIRKKISTELSPTMFLGSLGKYGVLDVVKDGSLSGDGGVEVVTVGRRVSFNEIYDMTKKIMDSVSKYGAFVDERTSVHYHLLTGYLSTTKYNSSRPDYGLSTERSAVFPLSSYDNSGTLILKDMEKPIPEVVLANFHQLYRRYENAIIWLTSTGTSLNNLTRWIKFRKPMTKYSAVRETMQKIIDCISRDQENSRYYSVNYLPVSFNGGGDIDRLHFEVRVCDGLLSPSAATAFAYLFYSILIKAIDISKYGILESGDREYMLMSKEIMAKLCNNSGGYSGPRVSYTQDLGHYVPILIKQTKELINFVKPVLLKEFGVFDILSSLSEKPISIRRAEGHSWDRIEFDICPKNNEDITEEERIVVRAADTNSILECASVDEWALALADDFNFEKQDIINAIDKLILKGLIIWDNRIGSIVKPPWV